MELSSGAEEEAALEAASGIKIHQTSSYLGVAGPRYFDFKDWMKASKNSEEKGHAKVHAYRYSPDYNFVSVSLTHHTRCVILKHFLLT